MIKFIQSGWKRITLWILPVFLIGITACAPTRVVRPLDKGEIAAGATFGGPMINFAGTSMPIPFASVHAGYGLDSLTTLHGGVNATSAAFGVVQTDVGAARQLLSPQGWRPGLSVSPSANFMVDVYEGNFRFYPQLDVNAWWEYSQKVDNFIYLGVSNWFELRGKRAHSEPQPTHWIPAIQAGHTFAFEHMDYTLETKYIAPFNSNENIVVDYSNPFNTGAFGIYFSFQRRF